MPSSEVLLQLAMAVACGGAIGLEREARGRAAGLRTVILVCLGATLMMIVSNELAKPGAGGLDRDVRGRSPTPQSAVGSQTTTGQAD